MAEPPFRRIGVVGLGLVGGSIAMAIRRAWSDVVIAGVDRADVLDEALGRRVIDDARPSVESLTDAELVVLAAPVPEVVRLVDAAGRAGLPSIVTDVASTKRHVIQAARSAGLRAFVGGHPMAGGEASGLGQAQPGLFDSRTWWIVADEAPPAAADAVERFALGLGAVPRRIDAVSHDRAVAFLSHLPQLVAVALMNAAGDATGEAGLSASGRAFVEMTRLASSPPELWRGILSTNADFVRDAVTTLAAALPTQFDNGPDLDRVEDAFRRAGAWRERMGTARP